MSDYLRTLVSGKKKRHIDGTYNLDLTYITDRIIAMGYPADSIHKLFRNDANDVYNFFETYHRDHWKILNVAMEINYKMPGNHVIMCGFEDHTPPPFQLLLRIIEVMHEWLSSDPMNVIAVHCKAGKGRTGTVIVSYLMYLLKMNSSEEFFSSNTLLFDTLAYFNSIRAENSECVSVPSQKRYCGYFLSYQRGEILPNLISNPVPLRLLNIEFTGSHSVPFTSISIYTKYNPTFKDLPVVLHRNFSSISEFGGYLKFESSREIVLVGDTLIKVYSHESCIFRFVFHTSFTPGLDQDFPFLIFPKEILDSGSAGPLNDHRIRSDFQCRVNFQTSSLLSSNNTLLNNTNNIFIETNIINNNNIGVPPPIPDRSKKPFFLDQ